MDARFAGLPDGWEIRDGRTGETAVFGDGLKTVSKPGRLPHHLMVDISVTATLFTVHIVDDADFFRTDLPRNCTVGSLAEAVQIAQEWLRTYHTNHDQ